MNVTVNYFGQLRQIVGRDSEPRECADSMGLGDLLADLAGEHGSEFRGMLMDEAGELRAYLLILVNGETIDKKAVCPLQDGDEITLLPPIAGG